MRKQIVFNSNSKYEYDWAEGKRMRKRPKTVNVGHKPPTVRSGKSKEPVADDTPSESNVSGDTPVEADILHGYSSQSCSTQQAVPDHVSYLEELRAQNGVTSVDELFTSFVLNDFDETKKILKDEKFQCLHRRPICFMNNWRWAYNCECNAFRSSIVTTLDSHVATTHEEFLKCHPVCIHISTLEEIMAEKDQCYGNDPEDHYRNAVPIDDDDDDDNNDPQSRFEHDVSGIWNLLYHQCMAYARVKKSYGIVQVQGGQLQCVKCHRRDCRHSELVKYAVANSEATDVPTCIQKIADALKGTRSTFEWDNKYKTYKPIPFKVTIPIRAVDAIPKDMDGRLKLQPNTSTCLCGAPASPQVLVRRKNCMLFTPNQVLNTNVYYKECSDENCRKTMEYDGQENFVLNMGPYQLTYEVLRNYMWQFLNGKATLYSYYQSLKNSHSDAGNGQLEDQLSYRRLLQAWSCYLKLLDIDYDTAFSCNVCGSHPDTIICDGTGLSFRREFALDKVECEEHHDLQSGCAFQDRIFIPHQKTRHLLASYSSAIGITEDEFTEMQQLLKKHQSSLLPLLTEFDNDGHRTKAPMKFRKFLQMLSTTSSVCATIHTDNDLQVVLTDIVNGQSPTTNVQSTSVLCAKCPVLAELLAHVTLTNSIIGIISKLQALSMVPFSQTKVKDQTHTPPVNEMAYFPNMQQIRCRGRYVADIGGGSSSQYCKKKRKTQLQLLPGIFAVFCPHSVCYGFEVMTNSESPNVPFTLLKTRFKTAPKLVIYDNSCNLMSYCLNRDPSYFQQTWFLIDHLHWANHKGCTEGHNIAAYPNLANLNSQVAEQVNASLARIKVPLAYMHRENFFRHAKFYLFYLNRPPHMKPFTENKTVQQLFISCALRRPIDFGDVKEINKPKNEVESFLAEDPDEYTVDTLRKGISMLCNPRKCRNVWNDTAVKPVWWPSDIQYTSPNDRGENQLRQGELVDLVNAYKKHMKSVSGEEEDVEEEEDKPEEDGSDMERGSEVGDSSGNEEEAEDKGVDMETEENESEDGKSEKTEEDMVTDPEDELNGEDPNKLALQYLGEMEKTTSINGLKRQVSNMETNLFDCLEDQNMPSTIGSANIRFPRPFRGVSGSLFATTATGNGNCLYNAVSICLYGSEQFAPLLRLYSIYRCISMRDEIANHILEDLGGGNNRQLEDHVAQFFLEEEVLDEEVRKRAPSSAKRKIHFALDEGLKETTKNHKYTGFLQIRLLATALNMPIHIFQERMDRDIQEYSDYVKMKPVPSIDMGNREGINILMCRMNDSSARANHFVPLLKGPRHSGLRQKKGNNKEQPYITLLGDQCSRRPMQQCIVAIDGIQPPTNMVECERCHRWVHCVCAGVSAKCLKADDKFICCQLQVDSPDNIEVFSWPNTKQRSRNEKDKTVRLRMRDLATVTSGGISDEVINFYVRCLQNDDTLKAVWQYAHVFSASDCQFILQDLKLRRTLNKEKNLIIFPVRPIHEWHWIGVCFWAKSDSTRYYSFVMDSLNSGTWKITVDTIWKYLNKLQPNAAHIGTIQCKVAEQAGVDCGLMLLQNIHELLKMMPMAINKKQKIVVPAPKTGLEMRVQVKRELHSKSSQTAV